jgi:hypothetical protein
MLSRARCGLFQSRSGTLKIQQEFCRRRDIGEGLFRRQPSIDLIYERTTVFERGPSPDLLEHYCTSIQQGLPSAYPASKAMVVFWTGTWHASQAGSNARRIQAWLGHKNIQHTVRYTELAPDRFRDFWR